MGFEALGRRVRRVGAVGAEKVMHAAERVRNRLVGPPAGTAEVRPLTELYPEARVIHLWPGDEIETPELASMRLHRDWHAAPRDRVRTPDAWVAELQGALVDMERNLLLDRAGCRVVAESVPYPDLPEAQPWPPDPAVFERPRVHVDGVAAVFRCFAAHGNHYHSLIDAIPRLHGLITDSRFRGRDINVLIDDHLGVAEAYVLAEILPGDMTLRRVPPDVIVEADELLFPGYVTVPDVGVLSRRYLDWFVPRMVPDRPPKRCEKVYVTRRDVGSRQVRNEADVIDGLLTRGFVEHHLSELTMAEQIELFYDAETVVAPHGAGLANLVFGSGVGVVELFNSPFVRPHYYYLSKAAGHRWRHVVSDRVSKDDDFTVDVGAVIRHVDELAD